MIYINKGILKTELSGIDASLKTALRQTLRYENIQQIKARAVCKKRFGYIPRGKLSWDGVTYLINEKNQFDTGLLPRVLALLESRGQPFAFLPGAKMPTGIPQPMQKELKPYIHQRLAIEAIKENTTGIIQIGTGGGKTKLSVVAASEIGQFPFLFVVNRISLLEQTHADYTMYFNEKIGFLGDGRVEVERINIATIGTLCSMLKIKLTSDDTEKLNYTPEQIKAAKDILKATKFVVIDECHHAAADTYKKLMSELPNAHVRIGLSATPFRTDGTDIMLEAAFGKIIYVKTASELIREKILCQPSITMLTYKDPVLSKIFPKDNRKANYATVYKQCVVENEVFNELVAQVAATNGEMGRLTLVSVKQVKHGEAILEIMQRIAPKMNTVFLHGKNKKKLDESKVKKDFADGHIPVLISTLFNEGVDIPRIDTVVDAGGGSSPINTLQLIGRALRQYPGKKKAYIYMFVQPYAHLYKHAMARYEILQTEEAFKVKVINWD